VTQLIKITAYITRKCDGQPQLLVFEEQGYEHLGFQVPGGTVMSGEHLEAALRREIAEECSVVTVAAVRRLGAHSYDLENRCQRVERHYYQVTTGQCPDAFTHVVTSEDEDNGWIYHYQWIPLNQREWPNLYGHLGHFLRSLEL